MTKYILVRHGQPEYNQIVSLGFRDQGLALAPLSSKVIVVHTVYL